MNPYQLLQVKTDATDFEIKQAYLALIKTHPPDQDPEFFLKISEAYEKIKNPEVRMQYELFYQDGPDFDELIANAFQNSHEKHLTPDNFLELFKMTSR